jgi:hypothetical protein
VKRLLPALLATAALTACGTTVPVASQLSSAGSDGLGTVAPGGTTQDGGLVPGGQQGGTGGTVTAPRPGTVTTGTTGTAGGTVGTTGTAVPTSGPKVTTPVRVGLLYLDGVDSFATTLGLDGLSTGDAVAQSKAIVGYLNKQGGLGGRQIDLRLGKVAAADAQNEAAWAAACAALTEDQKVEFVISYATFNESRIACYAKHGVPVLDDQSFLPDGIGRRYGAGFAAPGELAPGRSATELVEALWRTGWLTRSSKIGSLTYDTPEGADVIDHYLKPALAKRGLSLVEDARVANDAGAANQSSTALKFRTAGVDRVIPLLASPLFLMQAAESQGYRPQYAMTSAFGPGALLESVGSIKNQLKGARGIGWSKFLDIGAGTRPGPVSSNETLCFRIMADAGQKSTSATVQAFEVSLCNVLMLLKAGADAYGLTPGILSTLRAKSFPVVPADAYAITLLPTRADGVSAYRDLVYDEACSCFQYTSGNRATR